MLTYPVTLAHTKKTVFKGLLAALLSLPFILNADPKKDSGAAAAKDSAIANAADILPKDLLKGEDYTINPKVTVRESMGIYQMETRFGPTTVVGTEQLLERINELKAIKQLEAMKKTSVYADAVKNSALGPVETAKGLVTAPVDTVSNAARGIGGMFADIGYSLVGDNPDQESAAKIALGFAAAKRQFAYELGVNPYSDYQPLQNELKEVSWTAVGGGLTVTAGFMAIGGTAGTVVRASKTANTAKKLVRDNSPRKLQNINAEKLEEMGIEENLIEAFLNNHSYDPQDETRMVEALVSMKGVKGREELVKLAALQDNPTNARIAREYVELMAAYHSKISKATGIVVIKTAPFFTKADGSAVGVFPADYATPRPGLVEKIQGVSDEIKAKNLKLGEMWVYGKVDPGLQDKLLAMGWKKINANVGPELLS